MLVRGAMQQTSQSGSQYETGCWRCDMADLPTEGFSSNHELLQLLERLQQRLCLPVLPLGLSRLHLLPVFILSVRLRCEGGLRPSGVAPGGASPCGLCALQQ